MSFLCVVCAVFVLSIMLTACGSGEDDDGTTNGGTTIDIDWENDQVIVEVSNPDSPDETLTTPVRSLNNSDTPLTGWTLTQLGKDNDGDQVPDEIYEYEYDSSGYLERKSTYSTVDANGDTIGGPNVVVEYMVHGGLLDEIKYDTDGDRTVDKIVDYAYDSDDRIDDEEIYNSSSKAGDPDEIWQYDYKTDEGAFLKERYIGGSDEASEIIVYNSRGDNIKISSNPDASGVFQWVIEIIPTYGDFDNITKTVTIFYIGDEDPDTAVVTYRYTYDDVSGNLISYEADDGDNSTIDPVTSFTWVQN